MPLVRAGFIPIPPGHQPGFDHADVFRSPTAGTSRLYVAHTGADRIELELSGPVELIDMMEMGCSLGPIDVWVETIDRAPVDRENG